jgi:predicted transcriptional regulator
MISIRNNWVDSPRFRNIRSIIERLINPSNSGALIQPVYDESLEKLYKELKIFRNMVIRFIS